MTKERFRELVKRLHPDSSGTKRTLAAFHRVISTMARQKSLPRCWCGTVISRGSKHCNVHVRRDHRSRNRVNKSLGFGVAMVVSAFYPVTGQTPGLPYPKQTVPLNRVETPKGKEQRVTAMALEALPPPSGWAITWQYHLPLPRDGVEFDIDWTPTLSPVQWERIGRTNQPPFRLNVAGAFRVGVHQP